MTGKILVVGSLNMDLVIVAPRLPRAGESRRGCIYGRIFTGIAEGVGVEAAARLGNAATVAVEPSLPTRADVNNFLRGLK